MSPASAAAAPTSSRRKPAKPSCERCYFGVRGLCALELGQPCSTFRPDSPAGLVPPAQPALLMEADVAADAMPGPAALAA